MSASASPTWARPRSEPLAPTPVRVLQRQCACGSHAPHGAQCDGCRKERSALQRRPLGGREPSSVPPIVHDVLRSPGQPLDPGIRAAMEPQFGRDLSRVRVHAGPKAAESARAVDAAAYTVGRDIVWGPSAYAPQSAAGRRLLAHEIAHTVQQGSAATHGEIEIGDSGSAAERQADAAASRGASGVGAVSLSSSAPEVLQRQPATADVASARERGSTLPYREARDLAECTRIMGSENLEYCRREVLHEDVADAPLSVRAQRVSIDLADLIAGATWKEIRKRVYPRESAAGVRRAKERKRGTRPDLTGLGRIASLEHLAGAIRGVQRTWPALSADERVAKLGDAAKAEMTAVDVPEFLLVNKQPMEFKAFFRRDLWSFTISEALVTASPLADPEAAELANTTMHESRHAEQQFLAARFSAGQGNSAATIHADQDIPPAIAQKAVDKKFDAGTDPTVKALGQGMFAAMVTHGAANQAISSADGLPELARRKSEAETALRNLTGGVTGPALKDAIAKRNALRAQIIEVERLYALYRRIPYEADAHEIGDAAEQAFKGWP